MHKMQNDSESHARKGNRPPGLRGKQIGMYYKNKNKERNKEETTPKINLGCSVSVGPQILAQVQAYMEKFKNAPEEKKLDEACLQKFQHLLAVNFADFLVETKQDYESANLVNPQLDEKLYEKYVARLDNEQLRLRYEARLKLPAMCRAQHILAAVEENQVVLIVGSTGCGKTTQVPQLLLDAAIAKRRASSCRIICTQPRRISAISVAERVSYERGENMGNSVGYQIRLESVKPRDRGSITYCTSGVLLQHMQSDPLLHTVSVVVLDEVHERSVETDMLMGLLKKILPHRPTLKVILMSATVQEQDFCDYFDNCPLFRIEGVMFPVAMLYLEDILSLTGYKFPIQRQRRSNPDRDMKHKAMVEPYIKRVRGNYDDRVLDQLRLPESEGCEDINFIAELIYYICEKNSDGAILVFMPGYDTISRLYKLLTGEKGRMHNDLLVYPLHSMLLSKDQQSVFRKPPKGKRKIILSTSIAETSVTIDDVAFVINTGRTKFSNYDIDTNIKSLDEDWITQANAQQRKGRAGRVRSGICYNLYTKAREQCMIDMPKPEILRSSLEGLILRLKMIHIDDPYAFLSTLLSSPQTKAISNGVALLKRIEALDENGVLTPLGMHLAKLPIDPQLGKMMLMSALFRCIDPITSVAAFLSCRSPFYVPIGLEKEVDEVKRKLANNSHSDHIMVHNMICSSREDPDSDDTQYYNWSLLSQMERMKQQYCELLNNFKFLSSNYCKMGASNVNSDKIPLLRAIICAGLYPNMAFLKKSRQIKNRVRAIHSMHTDDRKSVNFHPSSVNSGIASFESNYFVFFERQKSRDLYLLDSTMVFPMALILFGDDVETGILERKSYISVAKTYYFKCNPETAAVVLDLRKHLKGLLLKKALYPAPIKQKGDEEQLINAIELLLSMDESMGEDYISSDEIDDI